MCLRRRHSVEIPVESWYKAIFTRRSRRIYKKLGVPLEKLDRLVSICQNFQPYPEARAVLIDHPSEHVYRGFMGSYGKILNAPGYIAFIGNMNSSRVQEAVGFTGQGIVLEATAMGLGTCWVGGISDLTWSNGRFLSPKMNGFWQSLPSDFPRIPCPFKKNS